MNPLLQPYNTPHNTIPFDKIKVSDFEESFLKSLEMHDSEIERIASCKETPTFKNTIEALEYSGELVDKVSTAFFNLLSAERNDDMDALSEKIAPLLSEHSNKVLHNQQLFDRVKHVYNEYYIAKSNSEELSTEQKTLLQNTYDGFIISGANLKDDEKEQFAKLTKELGLLEIKFSQNHLKDLNSYSLYITNLKDIEGLPETVLDMAKEEATQRKTEGWIFTLHSPCYFPFLTYCKNRSLRKEMYMAYNTLCTHDNDYNNKDIAKAIVNKKRQIAQLLGYPDYASYKLVKRMAEKKENIYNLFNKLTESYMPYAKKEVAEVESLAKKEEDDESFKLMPWDFSYYSNKLKEQQYNINSEIIRPYLQLDKVKEGIFGLAEQLYDIRFVKTSDVPVFHKDVETYEIYDKEGNYKALIYCDFFPRPSKNSGAWMTSYNDQYQHIDGTKEYPQVSITTNFTKPTESRPSLLTFGELETFLHEFGHALHGILSDVRYKSLSGTNVYWDFVELPSQLMENFACEKDFLRTFAFHYETGEPMPDEIIDNIIKSRNFNVAYSCIRQVSLGLLDMAYYTHTDTFDDDVISYEKSIFDHVRLLPEAEGTCMSVQFSHIMSGGYSAGYYSYKWAEVLDADAFSLFKETGIFNKETARLFKDNILSKGGTEHPMTLYKRFRGKEPSLDALLERNGIKHKDI